MRKIGFNIFKSIANKHREYQYAKMFSGQTPVFSQFGEDVYASDVVKNCVRAIASEMGKLQPKHIRTNDDDNQQTIRSSITRLLRYGPNELMTTSEFLEKCTWLRETTYNCFIYPKYVIGTDGRRTYIGFYPLKPSNVDFLQDITGRLFVKFTFGNGSSYTIAYSEIIHWRKDYSLNDFMGGNENGQVDNKHILSVLNINNTILEGLDKAVKASLTINGIMKINTMLNDENQKKEREKLEEQIRTSQSGIIAMDLKGDYIPLNRTNPMMVDKSTLEFMQSKILNNYGVSIPILTSTFTDEEYQAFYSKTLEPMINSLGQAFTKTLFSDGELSAGNEVIFYAQQLLFTNTSNKIQVADILGNRGALTDNQLLGLFGYPPFEGGDKRNKSLNFIDRDIADQYQMSKISMGKGVNKDDDK